MRTSIYTETGESNKPIMFGQIIYLNQSNASEAREGVARWNLNVQNVKP